MWYPFERQEKTHRWLKGIVREANRMAFIIFMMKRPHKKELWLDPFFSYGKVDSDFFFFKIPRVVLHRINSGSQSWELILSAAEWTGRQLRFEVDAFRMTVTKNHKGGRWGAHKHFLKMSSSFPTTAFAGWPWRWARSLIAVASTHHVHPHAQKGPLAISLSFTTVLESLQLKQMSQLNSFGVMELKIRNLV